MKGLLVGKVIMIKRIISKRWGGGETITERKEKEKKDNEQE